MAESRQPQRVVLDRFRCTIGIAVSRNCRHIRAALMRCEGRGLDARCRVECFVQQPVARQAKVLFRKLSGQARHAAPLASILSAQLAEVEAELVEQLLARGGQFAERVLAIGVHDPGLWRHEQGLTGYVSLSDAARLAELTGLNVIDAFAARDVALDGAGRPLLAIPKWLLLRHFHHARVLLELGPMLRATWLPAFHDSGDVCRIWSIGLGVGTRLVDCLFKSLCKPGTEHAAAQRADNGRLIEALYDKWLSEVFDAGTVPRRDNQQALAERLAKMAVDVGGLETTSTADLLCTATHLVAEIAARRMMQQLPASFATDEIVIAGYSGQTAFLAQQLAARLPKHRLLRELEGQITDESLGPAAVAVLALLTLDQVPGNSTAITGARLPRVLGRLTPGSPHAWHQLLRDAADHKSPIVSLRSAM